MAHKFEASLEWDCVTAIVRQLRDDDIDHNERMDLVQHAAWFIGCAAESFRKEEAAPIFAGSFASQAPTFAGIEFVGEDLQALPLHTLVDQLKQAQHVAQTTTASEGGGVPWDLILQIIIPLMREILKRLSS